jgi:hypothetical protein
MDRNKPRDDEFFNCSQEHEYRYVSRLYKLNSEKVHEFLERKCKDGTINYSKHKEVYELIKKELRLEIPG